ncbi:MAG TPA: hypothetical protein VD767_01805 [Thermomicrobiales bacterium]|nr:hypothetical protein [Thermomicrobiales bacterium]
MSNRRPARKREPEDRDAVLANAAPAPAADQPSTAHQVEQEVHDPGGWLAIMLMVMMIAVIGFVVVMAWAAA